MTQRKVFHVTKCEKGWATTMEGCCFPTRVSRKKVTAIKFAKSCAKSRRHDGQVIVHKADGTFEAEYTYGADPVRSRG
jgi:hypothetical protein